MIARLRSLRWLPYAASAVLSTVLLFWAYELWGIDWRVPLTYSGDALAVASHVKTVIETGWFSHQPDLGAPYGQFYGDYPQADNLHLLIMSAARFLVPDWGVLLNLYFVVGFPLAAVTATWFLRRVGVTRLISVALGVVYSLAPYHFIRGEGHLFLSAYFVVPLALVVLWRFLTDRPIWRLRTTGPRWLKPFSWRSVSTVLVLALLATASSYYAVFTAILIGLAGLSVLVRTRSWRRFLAAACAGAVLAVTVVLNALPDLVYQWINGPNPGALVRSPPEAELYSFKLASLLLPVPGHRFPPFAELRSLYDAHYPLPSEGPALGIIAGIGLLLLFAVAVHVLLAAGRPLVDLRRVRMRVVAILAGLSLIAFLFGTVGGAATFLSFIGFPIRAWDRILILISLFALTAVGIAIDGVLRRMRLARRRAVVAGVIAALVMLFAAWDQVPAVNHDSRAADVASFYSDEQFVAGIEAAVEPGCLIYQLPYVPFPESAPVNGVTDSQQLRMFLHSDDLRWSGGGIKGRPQIDQLGAIGSLPVVEMVDSLHGLGACGVVIDRAGYTDQGQQVLAGLQQVTGGTVVDSPGGRFAFLRF
ncbi:hypothetical protein DVJ78_07945 [Humibacter sp. BT305]|nr:hypothetical protein DVJ78_07945 [Humibacter sp. BT305]